MIAMDQGDRTTPVALPRDAPVAQPELHTLAAEAALFERRGDRIDRGMESEPGELAGTDRQSVLAVGRLPRRFDRLPLDALGPHDGADRDAVLRGELEVALIVRGHAHHRTLAVAHQHIVGDPDLDRLTGEGVQDMQAGDPSLLLDRGDIGFHGAAATALVDEDLQRRVARAGGERERMLCSDGHEGHAEQRIDTGGEDLERRQVHRRRGERGARIVGQRERDLDTLAAADPVGLHGPHTLRPAIEPLERAEQLIGVGRDVEVVHRDLALLDQRAGAPATAVDHLLVGEHGLVERIPVHDAGLFVCDAFFAHPQEQPLIPAVIGRVAGRELTLPVERKPERLQLLLHVRDVVAGPFGRGDAVGHRGVLRGQTERIPTHRLHHVAALHTHEARQRIADGVIAHMTHVQPPGGIREHGEAVELLAAG